MGKYAKPRGTHDVYPGADAWEEDSIRWGVIEDAFREACRIYGYRQIRTPIFEQTELFKRSIGDGTDIVNKEMYTFEDLSGRSLTLRPEGTAGVVRAYLDSPLHAQGGVTKLFYINEHFRYERPASGRYRQHHQLGVEAFGSVDPALDAEVIQLMLAFYKKVGITRMIVKINSVGSPESRAAYLIALKDYVAPYLEAFSEEGKARFANNPLRMLDTKSERELEILAGAPKLTAYLSDDERVHLDAVCGYLTDAGYAFELDPYLVRGFDYYTKTAFEVQSPDLGAQNALGGGGRYDKLVEQLGGKPTPGVGFGMGLERVLIALQNLGAEIPVPPGPAAFIVTLGDAARRVGIKLLAELRENGVTSDIEYGAGSMKSQMRGANSAGARYAVIMGDDEVEAGTVQLKDLAAGSQESVGRAEIIGRLKSPSQTKPIGDLQ
jgi:histidyl-tRNA synthetase